MAKLAAGFPHIAISVPSKAIDDVEFSLCRFNVAMTRFLRRGGKSGFAESPTNGHYYGQQQIPVARNKEDKSAMLALHLNKNTMIEVLIHGDLALPDDTAVLCYSDADLIFARNILHQLKSPWQAKKIAPPGPYLRRETYGDAVQQFINTALGDPKWRGNGLEFDRV